MQLAGLSVRGYKSLSNTSVESIPSVAAFIGPNNSGKSAVFQSIMLARLLVDRSTYFSQLTRGAAPADWVRDISTKHSERPISLDLTVRLQDQDRSALEEAGFPNVEKFGESMSLTLRATSVEEPQRIVLETISWSFDGQEFPYLVTRKDAASVPDLLSGPAAIPAAAWRSLDTFGRLKDFPLIDLGMVTQYPTPKDRRLSPIHLFCDWLRKLRWLGPERAFTTTVGIQQTPFADPSHLPRALQDLYNNSRPTFESVERLVSDLVPGVRRLEAPIEPTNQTTSVRVVSERIDSALVHAGHGVSCILAMIVELVRAEPGATVLIEEPETSVHPGAQRAMADLLERFASDRHLQILLTTHSPIFARDMSDYSTFAISIDDGGTQATKVTRQHFSLLKHELGAQNSDVFMADLVLFCEDQTTVNFLTATLPKLDTDPSVHGIYMIPLDGGGAGRLLRLREYLEYLRSSGVRCFVVLDDDDGAQAAVDALIADGLLGEQEAVVWQRDGKAAEFEDNFDPDHLVAAANSLAEDGGQEPSLRAEKLLQMSGGELMISKPLCRYYWDMYQYQLSKPQLGARLGVLFASGELAPMPEAITHLVDAIRGELGIKPPETVKLTFGSGPW